MNAVKHGLCNNHDKVVLQVWLLILHYVIFPVPCTSSGFLICRALSREMAESEE
jgi:hypothetical protein